MATESTKSNREHSFDFELASIVGVEKAILLKNINYWCKENKRKGLPNCLIDGHWFTQESLSSLADKYPYMRRSNIARWMQELFELEWIKVVASKGAKSFYGCGEVFELWDSNGDYKTKLSQNETAIKAKKDAAKLSQNETIGVPKQDSLSPKMGQTPILDIESNFEGNVEGEENAQNALTPPFTPAGTIESDEHVEIMLHLLEAEKKENDFTGAGPTPPAELLVTTHTPQAPYIRIVEKVEIQDAPGPKSPTTTPGRRSQAAPTIHPENLQAFDHFSDPEKCRMLWSEWIEYKWGQHRDKYKTAKSELVMLRKLYTWSQGQAEIVSQIIEKSVGNLYKGLIDPNEKKGNGTEKRHDLNPAQRQHLTLAQYVAQRRIDAENRNAME
jgi:hypothetical protein